MNYPNITKSAINDAIKQTIQNIRDYRQFFENPESPKYHEWKYHVARWLELDIVYLHEFLMVRKTIIRSGSDHLIDDRNISHCTIIDCEMQIERMKNHAKRKTMQGFNLK